MGPLSFLPYCYHCGAERRSHESYCVGCSSSTFVATRQETYGHSLMSVSPPRPWQRDGLKADIEAQLWELDKAIHALKDRANRDEYSVYSTQDRHGRFILPDMLVQKAQLSRELEAICDKERIFEQNKRAFEEAITQPIMIVDRPYRKRWFV